MTTPNDLVDKVDVPHFKERLWHELAGVHAERQHSSAPSGDGDDRGEDQVRGRARRSQRTAGIGVAAAAALLVGVLTFEAIGTDADRPVGSDTVLVERVAAATERSLVESVVHLTEEQVAPDGTRRSFEGWYDQTTGAARWLERDDQGNPLLDLGPLTGPTVDSPTSSGQRAVDYCAQEYIDHSDTGGASTNVEPGVVDVGELVAQGELLEHGTEVVDGRELIRLRGTDSEGGGFVLLVDPDSYRVVGQRGTFAQGPRETYTTVYEYLPRTTENLRLLVPLIPAGFTPAEVTSRPGSCDDS